MFTASGFQRVLSCLLDLLFICREETWGFILRRSSLASLLCVFGSSIQVQSCDCLVFEVWLLAGSVIICSFILIACLWNVLLPVLVGLFPDCPSHPNVDHLFIIIYLLTVSFQSLLFFQTCSFPFLFSVSVFFVLHVWSRWTCFLSVRRLTCFLPATSILS